MHQMIVVLALSVELFLVLQAQEQFLSKFLVGILNYTVVGILYHCLNYVVGSNGMAYPLTFVDLVSSL